jgi:hypothetical protein
MWRKWRVPYTGAQRPYFSGKVASNSTQEDQARAVLVYGVGVMWLFHKLANLLYRKLVAHYNKLYHALIGFKQVPASTAVIIQKLSIIHSYLLTISLSSIFVST